MTSAAVMSTADALTVYAKAPGAVRRVRVLCITRLQRRGVGVDAV